MRRMWNVIVVMRRDTPERADIRPHYLTGLFRSQEEATGNAVKHFLAQSQGFTVAVAEAWSPPDSMILLAADELKKDVDVRQRTS